MQTNIDQVKALISDLTQQANPKQAAILQRFFKTAPGEYGASDVFLGLKMPQTRVVARRYTALLNFQDLTLLLKNPYHEIRLAAALILVERYQKSSPVEKAACVRFYLDSLEFFNNWDLIDLSAPKILGDHILHHLSEAKLLSELAVSHNLWRQRAAIVATLALIKAGKLQTTLAIARKLMNHPHDLIHKAIGWMLRELGKKDQELLVGFLVDHHHQLHRTTLRYAIERLPIALRKFLL